MPKSGSVEGSLLKTMNPYEMEIPAGLVPA